MVVLVLAAGVAGAQATAPETVFRVELAADRHGSRR
jgi:hypothetical protein